MQFNRRDGIFGARGIEAATGSKKERWHANLVWTNYGNKKFCQNCSKHKLYISFPREEFRQFFACFEISKGWHISFRHDDDIILGGKQSLIKAEKFSDQPFDSVSSYGVSHFFGYGNSQPSSPLGITASYSCKVLRTSPHPLLVNSSISAVISYPFQFPVRLFFHAYRPSLRH